MSNNPFYDAIQPTEKTPITKTVEHPPFFPNGEEYRAKARNMSRQDMFTNGLLTVEDMDDEELRAGRMRDNLGRIPKVNKSMENIPRDLYDAMVAEHQTRTQERYRQNMDAALDTILGIMVDPAVEPKDRLDAAKHVKEQVMGKTPERVQVQLQQKAPWEEMFADFAQTTRAQHAARDRAITEGYIDAEVVEENGVSDVAGEMGQVATEAGVARDGFAGSEVGPEGQAPVQRGRTNGAVPESQGERRARGGHEEQVSESQPNVDNPGLVGDPRITPAKPTPTHDNPATNNSTAPPPNSHVIRWEQCDMVALAARRAAMRNRIDAAKKRRKALRAMGADVMGGNKITTELVGEGDTGKLRHTIG